MERGNGGLDLALPSQKAGILQWRLPDFRRGGWGGTDLLPLNHWARATETN